MILFKSNSFQCPPFYGNSFQCPPFQANSSQCPPVLGLRELKIPVLDAIRNDSLLEPAKSLKLLNRGVLLFFYLYLFLIRTSQLAKSDQWSAPSPLNDNNSRDFFLILSLFYFLQPRVWRHALENFLWIDSVNVGFLQKKFQPWWLKFVIINMRYKL